MNSRMSSLQEHGNDLGLLFLRLGVGVSMIAFFGLTKIRDASAFLHTGQWSFVDFNRKVGLPLPVLIAFAQTANETLVALLLALGLGGRMPGLLLFIGFVAATACSMKAQESWLLPGYFALIFGTLALTGPGRLTLDSLLKWRARAGSATETK